MMMKSILIISLLTLAVVGMANGRPRSSKFGLSKRSFIRSVRSDSMTKATQAPHIKMRSVPMAEMEIPMSSSRVLECEAGGSPPPVIHWLKNGQRIESNRKMSAASAGIESIEDMITIENEQINPIGILGLSFTRSKLYLDCVSPADEAIYTCVAENAFSRVVSESKVQIVKSDLSSFSALSEECSVDNNKRFGSPARINMWSKTRLEVIGSEVQLFCRSSGFPKPVTSWVGPDGAPITTYDRFEVTRMGDLIIRDLSWSDMGGYTCLATNPSGEDHAVTFLYPTMPEKEK